MKSNSMQAAPPHAITSIAQLPVPEPSRNCTDKVCLIFAPLLFIAVLASAVLLRKPDHIAKLSYPVDSDVRTCGYELPEHPHLYYPDSNNLNQQLCVTKCPSMSAIEEGVDTDQRIECKPTKGIPLCPKLQDIFDTERVDTERGSYCLPKEEGFRYRVIEEIGLVDLKNEKSVMRTAKACIPLAIGVGVLGLVLVQLFPGCAVWAAVVVAGGSCVGVGVLVWLGGGGGGRGMEWERGKVLRIVLSGVLVFIGVTMLLGIWIYRGQIALCQIFLKYAGIFLRYYSPKLFLLIPIYLLITTLFLLISSYIHTSFSSFSPPTLSASKNHYVATPSPTLTFINLFALVWSLNFLRDSFTYIVSGNSIEWYFTHRATNLAYPATRMFLKNLGSVLGGSYLNTLLFLPSIIYNTVTCQQKMCNCCHSEWCSSISSFLNMARKDSYGYMNLTGIQICDSARECQQLAGRSPLYPGNQSSVAPIRIAFHLAALLPVVIVTIVYLVGMEWRGRGWELEMVGMVVVGGWCGVMYFVDIHADVAEGLQVGYFVEHQLYQVDAEVHGWVGPVEMIAEIEGARGYEEAGNMTII